MSVGSAVEAAAVLFVQGGTGEDDGEGIEDDVDEEPLIESGPTGATLPGVLLKNPLRACWRFP